MPKHDEKVYCINHKDHEMTAGLVSLPQVNPETLDNPEHLEDNLIVTAYMCTKCMYLEFYAGTPLSRSVGETESPN